MMTVVTAVAVVVSSIPDSKAVLIMMMTIIILINLVNEVQAQNLQVVFSAVFGRERKNGGVNSIQG
jgi:hypothetical protein